MPKKMVEHVGSVPVDLLQGIIHSFTQGMSYFQSTDNLLKKLDEILKHGETDGKRIDKSSEGAPQPEPGAAAGNPGIPS